MKKIDLKFPDNFYWGAAASAHQTEGEGSGKLKRARTVWEILWDQDPKDFFLEEGPQDTCDFLNKYKEDIKMMSDVGFNSMRTSFSWARLFPDGKTLNKAAYDFYKDMLMELNSNGIKPIMNIYHFDMPEWAAKLGGWESKEVINSYVRFGEFIMKEFGNDVECILTNVEPSIPAIYGYQHNSSKLHYPSVIDNDRYFQVWWGTILGHARITKIYHKKYKSKIKAKLGISIIVAPTYPKDNANFTPADQVAAQKSFLIRHGMWLEPMVAGKIPKALFEIAQKHNINWNYSDEEIKEINDTKIDFLAANFYNPARVEANPGVDINKVGIANYYGKPYKWKGGRFNVFRGWEIYPEGFYDTAMYIKNKFDNIPFMFAENGMGVEKENKFRCSKTGEIQDDYRISFVSEHLKQAHRAIQDGANLIGYHMWGITDNWSWKNSFKNRYGFFELDLKNRSRKYKKSAHWYKEVIKNNGINLDFKPTDKVIDLLTAEFIESKK